MFLLDSDNVLYSFFNPSTLYFWGFWGMLIGVILIKSWNRILRFKYNIETKNWIIKESDEEIKRIYKDHIDLENRMKEKYPDWTPPNKWYNKKIRDEYNKRFRGLTK